MPEFPATFVMNSAHEWRWYLLDSKGIFLAESIECYSIMRQQSGVTRGHACL